MAAQDFSSQLFVATIPSGDTVSQAIRYTGWQLMWTRVLTTPTGTNVTVQFSFDGENWADVDNSGLASLDAPDWTVRNLNPGATYIRLVSDATEAADLDVELIFVSAGA